ncbi:hypothetical protein JCM11641_002071 [Rhodosporidiobolus odoratus]
MSHELAVEGDKVLEKDERGNVLSEKEYTRVHAGYLAASHNKSLSQETRDNAAHLATDLSIAHGDAPGDPTHASTSHRSHHSASPRTSHVHSGGAEEVEDELASDVHVEPHIKVHHHEDAHHHISHGSHGVSDTVHDAIVHEHRVIGGYKAVLHRPTTTDEGRQHARDKLQAMGIDPDSI